MPDRHPRLVPLLAALLAASLAACGGDEDDAAADRGACPTEPVSVVVTVDQWGDIVERLGGDCARVTTIIEGSTADPHDHEPSPSDSAAFEGADLVVQNGLGYDAWAGRAVDTLDEPPPILDAGAVVGLEDGDNPHVWYGPDFVRQVAVAVTDQLTELAPAAAGYLDARQVEWDASMQPYDDELAAIRAVSPGRAFAATEPVFDHMAEAVGLTDATPGGFRRAVLNESEPAPADLADFEDALLSDRVSVLMFNSQTEGPTPDRLRVVAEDAAIPVVEVTESLPPDAPGFVEWQVDQLVALRGALAG